MAKAKKKAPKKAPKKATAARKTKAPSRAVAKKTAAKKPAAKKPAAKKLAAKGKAAPARTVKKKAAAKPARKPARAKPIQRRDHAGHIDPKYGRELLDKGEPREDDPKSFIPRARSKDDLVEELGEEFVKEATSAEYDTEGALNQDVSEEVGGPFVETPAGTEFARGTDASNPKGATREPFPRT